MKKEVIMLGSLILVIIGLIIMATSTISTSYTTRFEMWLSETIQIPAKTHKMYNKSFPAGSILWVKYRVIEQGGVSLDDGYPTYPEIESWYLSLFAVMDETNYNNWQANQSTTYIKAIETSQIAGIVFSPPPDKTLYFVFDNSFGEQPTDKKVTIDIVRLWNEYRFLLPSEAKYVGFILLALGFVAAGYGIVSKPETPALEPPIKILSVENFVRMATVVGLVVLLISALLTWVNVYNVFGPLLPEDGYVSFYLDYSSSLSTYLLNLPMTMKGLNVVYYVEGYPDIALSLAITLATYPLSFLFGAIGVLSSFKKKKGVRQGF